MTQSLSSTTSSSSIPLLKEILLNLIDIFIPYLTRSREDEYFIVLKLLLCNIYPYILPNFIEPLVKALINKYSLRSLSHRDALLVLIHCITECPTINQDLLPLHAFPIPSKYTDFVTYRYGDTLSCVDAFDSSMIDTEEFENNSQIIIDSLNTVIYYCISNNDEENENNNINNHYNHNTNVNEDDERSNGSDDIRYDSPDLLTRISFLCLCLENVNPFSIQSYPFLFCFFICTVVFFNFPSIFTSTITEQLIIILPNCIKLLNNINGVILEQMFTLCVLIEYCCRYHLQKLNEEKV